MTLYELGAVAAISIVLIVLAVISTQNLVVRTKVSRVREDQRIVARALQNYSMDHAVLPPPAAGLRSLVQPTAYLGSLPRDPFQGDTGTYLYLSTGTTSMASVIVSPGPDGDFDIPPGLWPFASLVNVDKKLLPPQYQSFGMAGMMPFNAQLSSSAQPERDSALLEAYIDLKQYNAARGLDGDIITPLVP